jgi:hypothetical protein
MKSCRLLRLAASLAAMMLSAMVAIWFGSAANANVARTQVSSDPYVNTTSFHATEVEPDTFASGSTFIGAFQSGRFKDGGASNVGWATSTDGGASYAQGFLPGTTVFASPAGKYARDTDPSVVFDAKHGVWLINSLLLSKTSSGIKGAAVIVNRSIDGGLSWGRPVDVAAASGSQDFDKNWITCDNTPTSPHYGNCYVEWDDAGHMNQLAMAFSSDGGITWTASAVPAGSGVIAGQPLAKPNGTVIVPIDNSFETVLESFVSTDGGVSYIGPFQISTIINHNESGGLRSSSVPTAEMNAKGKVYVAWSDCRFVKGCAANDIVYTTSADGMHWSTVTRIPIDPTTSGVDHFLPGLGVDRHTSGSTTLLGLTYYFYPKTGCTTTTCRLDVGFIGSSDGGRAWSSPIQLAGPARLNELPETTQGYMVGDYLSTSFLAGSSGDAALSVFAVGMPVAGTSCVLKNVTSCNEPMEAPSDGLAAFASGANVEFATAEPIASTRSDHAAPLAPLTLR